MSNLTESDRAQMERATLSGYAEGIRHGTQRGTTLFVVIAFAILAGLSYGAITIIEGWWQWLVLGAFAFMAVAVMVAVSPNRRG